LHHVYTRHALHTHHIEVSLKRHAAILLTLLLNVCLLLFGDCLLTIGTVVLCTLSCDNNVLVIVLISVLATVFLVLR
jgi:hypothetical protein